MDVSKSSNDKSLDAIDIFLFSNGQQNSPPRKYYLSQDDLKQWDNALKFLARSQYGSLQSTIQLHTLEGIQVLTATELKNGAAYVAVMPTEQFKQAGYDKYLIKASRSLEKRKKRMKFSDNADGTHNDVQTDDISINIPTDNIVAVNQISKNTTPNPRKSTESKIKSLTSTNPRVSSGLKPFAYQVSQHPPSITKNQISARTARDSKKTLLSKQELTFEKPTRLTRPGVLMRKSKLESSNTIGVKPFTLSPVENLKTKTIGTALARSNTTKYGGTLKKTKIPPLKRSDQSQKKQATEKLSITDTKENPIDIIITPILTNLIEFICTKTNDHGPCPSNINLLMRKNKNMENVSNGDIKSNKSVKTLFYDDLISELTRVFDKCVPNKISSGTRMPKVTDVFNELSKNPKSGAEMLFLARIRSVEKLTNNLDTTSHINKTTQDMIDSSQTDAHLHKDIIQNIHNLKSLAKDDQKAIILEDNSYERSYGTIKLHDPQFLQQDSSTSKFSALQNGTHEPRIFESTLKVKQVTPNTQHNDNRSTDMADQENIFTTSNILETLFTNQASMSSTKNLNEFESKSTNDKIFNFHGINQPTLPDKDTTTLGSNNEKIFKTLKIISLTNDDSTISPEIKNKDNGVNKNNIPAAINRGYDSDFPDVKLNKLSSLQGNGLGENFFKAVPDNTYNIGPKLEKTTSPRSKISQVSTDNQSQRDTNNIDLNVFDNLNPNLRNSHNNEAQSVDINPTRNSNKVCDINIYNFNEIEDMSASRIILQSPVTSKMSPCNNTKNKKHLVAVVHTGDIIKLQVNMEVRAPNGTLKSKRSVDALKSTSAANVFNEEHNDDDQLKPTKSLQPRDNDDASHEYCRKSQNNIFKKCTCCEQFDVIDAHSQVHKNTVNLDMQPYYVLMAVAPPKTSTVGYNESSTDEKRVQYTQTFTDGGNTNTFNETVVAISTKNTNESITNEQLIKGVPKKENECIHSEMVVLTTETSQTSRYMYDVHKCESVKSTECSICLCRDASSQTDWFNVLLEARLHADGHYTFHLPSITTLRQFNLQ